MIGIHSFSHRVKKKFIINETSGDKKRHSMLSNVKKNNYESIHKGFLFIARNTHTQTHTFTDYP